MMHSILTSEELAAIRALTAPAATDTIDMGERFQLSVDVGHFTSGAVLSLALAMGQGSR
jgi:hypothetical protein